MVVLDGETDVEPLALKVPTPAMVTDVALGTFQVSVELWPGAMIEGEALNDDPATVGQLVTVTVTSRVVAAQDPLACRR